MREMPVKRAGEILGEGDPRLSRMLFLHVKAAYAALDLSDLIHVGADGMNLRKGHEYLITMLYFVAGKLSLSSHPSHRKQRRTRNTFATFGPCRRCRVTNWIASR